MILKVVAGVEMIIPAVVLLLDFILLMMTSSHRKFIVHRVDEIYPDLRISNSSTTSDIISVSRS